MWAVVLVCISMLACSDPAASRMPTLATCPSVSNLTYENFGKPFMEKYCTRCHSSELKGSARNGAPLYHDFDSLLGILVVADHVDEYTAAGPQAVNEMMPPDGVQPTLEERTQLGEWLACELLQINDRPDAGAASDAGVVPDAGAGPDAMSSFVPAPTP